MSTSIRARRDTNTFTPQCQRLSELEETLTPLPSVSTSVRARRDTNTFTPQCQRLSELEETLTPLPSVSTSVRARRDTNTFTPQCQRLSELEETLTPLLMGHDTVIYLDTVASHLTYEGESTLVSPGADLLLLERWVIRLENAG